MKTKSLSILIFIPITILGLLISCEEDSDDNLVPTENQFISLDNPYLICTNRNPGGVGFDFEYDGQKGGANNMDSLTVNDFEYDLTVKTLKAEKPDGSLGGAPFIKLHETVKSVNYSTIDNTCKGYTDFINLSISNIQAYTLIKDDTTFDPATVTPGTTGSPLMNQLLQEYNKLAIGQKWKSAANNDTSEDEPIWLVQTREGKIVKLIVTQFPSNPAPTSTGYITIKWDFVK